MATFHMAWLLPCVHPTQPPVSSNGQGRRFAEKQQGAPLWAWLLLRSKTVLWGLLDFCSYKDPELLMVSDCPQHLSQHLTLSQGICAITKKI